MRVFPVPDNGDEDMRVGKGEPCMQHALAAPDWTRTRPEVRDNNQCLPVPGKKDAGNVDLEISRHGLGCTLAHSAPG